ncbi:hypothetical protein G9A89_003428 [Geosiphon pyriformis]|nr:hypothetical protein G9A89_003428 [Geosiphon pyriformis]
MSKSLEMKDNGEINHYEKISLEMREISNEKRKTLRKVPDKIPSVVIGLALIAFCELFAYVGVNTSLQNYIQFSVPQNGTTQSGALGKGQQIATALQSFLSFWGFTSPILIILIRSRFVDSFDALMTFLCILIFGIAIIAITSIPISISAGLAFPGLIIGLIVMGFGFGLKMMLNVIIGEQHTETKQRIKVLKSGEKVIVDPILTLQSYYHWYYMGTVGGALAPIITTNIERYHSYWLTFSISAIFATIGAGVFIYSKKLLAKTPKRDPQIWQVLQVIKIALKNGRNLENAKPLNLKQIKNITWDDKLIDDLRIVLYISRNFLFYPFYFTCYIQMANNLVSQAATMETGIIPNNLVYLLSPITVVILIPIMDKLVYPFLRKLNIVLLPIKKIFIGFILMTLAMIYTTLLQAKIYRTGPCFERSPCEIDGRMVPNRISVWFQTPIYLLIGFSEIFFVITNLGFVFGQAPASMKELLMSFYMLTIGIGSGFAILLVPLSKNPLLTYMYFVMTVIVFIAGCLFYYFCRNSMKKIEKQNLDNSQEVKV